MFFGFGPLEITLLVVLLVFVLGGRRTIELIKTLFQARNKVDQVKRDLAGVVGLDDLPGRRRK